MSGTILRGGTPTVNPDNRRCTRFVPRRAVEAGPHVRVRHDITVAQSNCRRGPPRATIGRLVNALSAPLSAIARRGTLVLLVAAAALTLAFDLRVVGLVVVTAGFGIAGYGVAGRLVPTRAPLERLLLTVTFGVAALALAAEVLSLLVLLGSPAAWVLAATVCGVVGGALQGRPLRRPTGADLFAALGLPARPSGRTTADTVAQIAPGVGVMVRPVRPAALAGPMATSPFLAVGRAATVLLVLGAALHLLAVFVLSWFSGINIFDSISHYLPRSVRFLQYGTFGIFATYYDFMQYLHQTVVAVQLLFLRSDILVNPTSFLAAALACTAIFALARSLGWPAPYPLFAALVPLSMPVLLLHASTSNFDTFTALWLASTLYFLRRGFATTQPGWLLAAATATALAFASKPTAWFAVPGLGLLWLATFGRAALRHRLRRAVPLFAACAVIVVLVGAPFLLRNVISRGYIVAPPEWQSFQLGGEATGATHRLRLLEFNMLALGLQVLTPPILLPAPIAGGLDGWFTSTAQVLGYRLPDPSITVHAEWPGLIRHVTHRYDSNHTGLGAAFVLVTLPSLLALPFARRRLGPRWWYALGLALAGLSYFVVLNTVSIYSVNNIRYLIEMVAMLAALGPLLFVLLPRRVGATLALTVGALLLVEMHDVVANNKQVPPDLVMRVPRSEQYEIFNGNFPTAAHAAAVMEQKYPPDELPDVYIEDTGAPTFPDYAFLGASLLRRTHNLKVADAANGLPGPFLTRNGGTAQQLAAGGRAVVDQLGMDTWLLLPNDRPRVVFWSTRDAENRIALRLQMSVPPGQYRSPQYAVTIRTVRGNERVRAFDSSPTLDISYDIASRGTIEVEFRDGDDSRRVERIRIERPRFMGI